VKVVVEVVAFWAVYFVSIFAGRSSGTSTTCDVMVVWFSSLGKRSRGGIYREEGKFK
jgi:hypothetical protein